MCVIGAENMKEYFCVSALKYVSDKAFNIIRPASLNNAKDNAVMFIMGSHIDKAHIFEHVDQCLVFWPQNIEVPEIIELKHAVYKCGSPRTEYCKFFYDNNIVNLPPKEKFKIMDGAYIAESAQIGKNVTILPGAYISGECVIENNVYIGVGAKLVGEVIIGNNVVIRENTVIGADGLSTDRAEDGKAITMPQFGKVVLEDNVQIGANTVIARGAIDETRIHRGAKVDSSCFISHNTSIGEDSFVVGETIMFGSSTVGKQCLISGNCTLANFIHVGDNTTLGMSATVLKDVPANVIAFGSPIKAIKGK